jgi:hypothetical protein
MRSNQLLAMHCDRLRALVARLEAARGNDPRTALLEDLRNQVALMRALRRIRRGEARERTSTQDTPPPSAA